MEAFRWAGWQDGGMKQKKVAGSGMDEVYVRPSNKSNRNGQEKKWEKEPVVQSFKKLIKFITCM